MMNFAGALEAAASQVAMDRHGKGWIVIYQFGGEHYQSMPQTRSDAEYEYRASMAQIALEKMGVTEAETLVNAALDRGLRNTKPIMKWALRQWEAS